MIIIIIIIISVAACAIVHTDSPPRNRLFGQVVKASASRAEDPEFESRRRRDFSRVESYQWLRNWHSSSYPSRRYRVSAVTGWPVVRIL